VIDLHAHVLPAVDDGPRTLDGSLDILRSMQSDGVRTVVATPHVREDWPTSVERMQREVEALRAAATRAGVTLEIRTGAEIALTRLPALRAEERAAFGLGGNPRLLLLEFPYAGWPVGLEDIVFRLRATGVVPLLAHPERNPQVQDDPGRLGGAVRSGALTQVTAASVDGRLGSSPRKCARRLVELGLAHVLASDAHAPTVRAAGLRAAAESLGPLGVWMTQDVPAALLEGREPPSRPPSHRRRWLRDRR
jgi:protein-tyrosine phosphatase